MDDVSSVKFIVKMIRQPKKQGANMFEYAACLDIKFNNESFLKIEDIYIVDFIYKLSRYTVNLNFYEFVPIDSQDKVLVFKKINSDSIEISSEWTNKNIVVKQEDIMKSIKQLRLSFEKNLKISIDRFYQCKHR